MPLYEFECPDHGRFEELMPRLPEEEWHECPEAKEILPGMWINCIRRAPLVPSRVSMRPDTLWAGHVVEGYGYVTSSSNLAKIQKDRHLVEVGDQSDRDAVHKTAADARKEKKEKFAKETRAFIEEEFSGKGMIDSFGEITPEANRPLSDKPLTDTKDERLKS